MTVLRPFRTGVDPIARDDPWSTTQLPAGVTEPFDIRNPSGSMVLAILPASFNEIGVGDIEQAPRPQLFIPGALRSVARLDHVSPLPTIVNLTTGGDNTSGTLRVWVSASPDLHNGVWCEIERTASDDVPAVFFANPTQIAVGYETLSEDDGRSDDFGIPLVGFPAFVVNGSKVLNRLIRLRYGYTEDGEDTIVGAFRSLTARPSGVALEVAAQPLDAVASEASACPVSIFLRVRQSPLDQETDSFTVLSFDCPSEVLRQGGEERLNVLQWTHESEAADDERNNSPPVNTTPLPVTACSLATAIDDGITRTVPRVEGLAESEGLKHRQWLFDWITYSGTPEYNRPDVAERGKFAVKNGPWWHDPAIVSPGTTAAITGARHRLTITMPEWNEGLAVPSVSYGFNLADNPRFLIVENNAALARRVLQGQQFVCDPTLGDEPLLQGCYAAARQLDLIDTQNAGPLDPAITNTDFTLLPYAQVFVRTSPEFQYERKNFQSLNPWSSRDAALEAGMPEDAYDYYANSSDDYFNAVPEGVRIYVQVGVTYQWTVTRIEPTDLGIPRPSTGYLRRHFTTTRSFLFFLTDAQCVAMANGETVNVAEYGGGLPSVGGIATGYTAAMSLSVLS